MTEEAANLLRAISLLHAGQKWQWVPLPSGYAPRHAKSLVRRGYLRSVAHRSGGRLFKMTLEGARWLTASGFLAKQVIKEMEKGTDEHS